VPVRVNSPVQRAQIFLEPGLMLPGGQNGPGQIPEIQFEIKFRAGRRGLLPLARDLPLAVLEGAFTRDLDIGKRTFGFQRGMKWQVGGPLGPEFLELGPESSGILRLRAACGSVARLVSFPCRLKTGRSAKEISVFVN